MWLWRFTVHLWQVTLLKQTKLWHKALTLSNVKRFNSCSVPMLWRLAFSWLITVLAMLILNFCKPMIFSSKVPRVIRRYTFTTRFWNPNEHRLYFFYPRIKRVTSVNDCTSPKPTCPIRCARSIACRSLIGFQSCSTNTTVSAPVRFKPRPPTCVVRSSTSIDGSLLNLQHTKGKSERWSQDLIRTKRFLFIPKCVFNSHLNV